MVPFRRFASKLGMSNAKAVDPKLNSTELWLSSPTHGYSGLCHVSRGGGSGSAARMAEAVAAGRRWMIPVGGIGAALVLCNHWPTTC